MRTTERGFPDWMYDDNVWNDLPRMLNATSLDHSWKRLRLAAGWKSEPIAPDGYKEFLPDEKNYDLAKVKSGIGLWSRDAYPAPNGSPQIMANVAAPPALVWIDEILSLGWKRGDPGFHARARYRSAAPRFVRISGGAIMQGPNLRDRIPVQYTGHRLPDTVAHHIGRVKLLGPTSLSRARRRRHCSAYGHSTEDAPGRHARPLAHPERGQSQTLALENYSAAT